MTQGHQDHEPVENYREALRRGVPFRDKDGDVVYPTTASRPDPEFTLDRGHRLLLIGSVVTALVYTGWILLRIPSMPDQIPVHFAADGSVNRYGSPWEMLWAAVPMLATIIGCAVLTRYPKIYNFGIGKVTETNIQAHYRNAVQLMVWMVFSATVLHIAITGVMAGDWSMSPSVWLTMALLLGVVAYFILRMKKL